MTFSPRRSAFIASAAAYSPGTEISARLDSGAWASAICWLRSGARAGPPEAEAAGWSLPLILKEWPGASRSALSKYQQVGFKELFEEAAAGDAVALAVRDRCLGVWCAAAIALVHACDPEIIVLGGGVMKSALSIIPILQSHVEKYAWTPWGKVQVRAAELGNNAALLGAVPLLSEKRRS